MTLLICRRPNISIGHHHPDDQAQEILGANHAARCAGDDGRWAGSWTDERRLVRKAGPLASPAALPLDNVRRTAPAPTPASGQGIREGHVTSIREAWTDLCTLLRLGPEPEGDIRASPHRIARGQPRLKRSTLRGNAATVVWMLSSRVCDAVWEHGPVASLSFPCVPARLHGKDQK